MVDRLTVFLQELLFIWHQTRWWRNICYISVCDWYNDDSNICRQRTRSYQLIWKAYWNNLFTNAVRGDPLARTVRSSTHIRLLFKHTDSKKYMENSARVVPSYHGGIFYTGARCRDDFAVSEIEAKCFICMKLRISSKVYNLRILIFSILLALLLCLNRIMDGLWLVGERFV